MVFRTRNNTYTLIDQGDGAFLISGHPEFCPFPVRVRLRWPVQVGAIVNFIPCDRPDWANGILTTRVQEIIEP